MMLKKISEALIRFASIVQKGLLECDYVPGSLEFIKQQFFRIASVCCSGSDEEELQEIFSVRS